MPVGALAFWLVSAIARTVAAGHSAQTWAEHIEVTARVVPTATRAAHLGEIGALDPRSLAAAGPDLARWAALTERVAGARGTTTTRVDGMEGGALPDSVGVASMSLDPDPFSVASSSASGGVIDIVTAPRTRWSVSGNPGFGSIGATNPLGAPAPRSRVRSLSAGGPIDRAKRTSIWFSTMDSSSVDRPTFADPAGALHLAADHSHTSGSWSTGVNQSVHGFQLSATGGAFTSRDDAAGVRGEQGPSGALNLTSRSRFARLSVSGQVGFWTIRGGASYDTRNDSADALSSGRGRVFANILLDGAPDATSQRADTRTLRVRFTASTQDNGATRWLVGAETTRGTIADTRVFNPDGVVIVASPTAIDGVMIRREGAARADVTMSATTLFAERVLVDRGRLWLRGGTRITGTSRGADVDPRLTAGINGGPVLFGVSAGLYTTPWPVSVEVERQLLHPDGERVTDAFGRQRIAATAGDGDDRRDAVIRTAVGHSGRVSVEADQTWRLGWRLAGLTRRIDGPEIIDTIDADRRRRESDTHISLAFAARDWTVSGNYTLAVARDNSDGALGFGPDPATTSPWAPSATVPRHLASAVLSGGVGRGVRMTISAETESGTAYSRVTGADPAGLLAFSGLDGTRHQYRSTGSRDVSAYMARAIAIRRWGVAANAGLRIENMFNAVSPLAIAQTSISSRAGQPVSTAPGRSMSIWATFGWR